MGLITINDESDGTSADANDLNSRFAIVTGLVNGNIDSANIKNAGVVAANLASNSVTTDKILDDAVTAAKTSFGGDYTTGEINTGFTWVDGKTIYKKTVNMGSLPNNASKNVAHGITGITNVLSIDGAYTNGTITFPVNRPDTTGTTGVINTFVNGADITVSTAVDRTAFSGYATIEYTKV